MALKSASGDKFIKALIALGSVITAYVCNSFFLQIGEWFELEAHLAKITKMVKFGPMSQGFSLALGLMLFVGIIRNVSARNYLKEVYAELVKVVWAKKDDTVKLTVGILIGVVTSSIILGLVDFGIGKFLGLLY